MATRGTVAAEGNEALLGVEVLSQAGSSSLRVEAVVDTGFTGHLTLPRATVDALGLPIIGSAESILADGSLLMEDVCLARVLWHVSTPPGFARRLVSTSARALSGACQHFSIRKPLLTC